QAYLCLRARARARQGPRRRVARGRPGSARVAGSALAEAGRSRGFHRPSEVLTPGPGPAGYPLLRDNCKFMSAIGKADRPGSAPEAGSADFDPAAYELLKTIDDPAALRAMDRRALGRLAVELRAFLLESVSQTGGHLSSNLGTVELTVALHHVFNTPHDRIVWDVGHQTYAHKILTGR